MNPSKFLLISWSLVLYFRTTAASCHLRDSFMKLGPATSGPASPPSAALPKVPAGKGQVRAGGRGARAFAKSGGASFAAVHNFFPCTSAIPCLDTELCNAT